MVVADVILRSYSGESVILGSTTINPRNVKDFLPSAKNLEVVSATLRKLGFQIDLVAATHVTISGSPSLFSKVFAVRLVQRSVPVFAPPTKHRQSYYEASTSPRIPEQLSALVEAINFPKPPTYYVSPAPPAVPYDHIEIPDGIARDMDALKLHLRGITGTGIRLAMVDSGFMTPFHPYYVGRNYNIQPLVVTPGDTTPGSDQIGHGTGIAACALAVAPGVTFIPVKLAGSTFAEAVTRAIQQNPDIISGSWTSCLFCSPYVDPALQLVINNAVASGIVVVFACGNAGSLGWPGSDPSVISVGGAFIGSDDSIQASSYASSGTFRGRQVPDLCGIVGQSPKGILITLPTQPGSMEDSAFAGGVFPNGDQTASNDGWLVASGTSSATPMVAGVVALLMQGNPALVRNPQAVRLALMNSCVDVTAGTSANNESAGPGPDLATGAGLVQAFRGASPVDVWIKDNPDSDVGLVPTHNSRPFWPPYAHWTSPDIKVFDAMLANPLAEFDATPSSEPIFGVDNFIYVRIRNRGTQVANPVDVRLYYADPSTNLSFPADWKDGQSGVSADGSLTVAGIATNLQGSQVIPSGGNSVLLIPFTWRPPDPTTATRTQTLPDGRTIGHFCLLVTLDSQEDPIGFQSGNLSVILNNNIAMKNVGVYSGPSTRIFRLAFFVKGRPDKPSKSDLLFYLNKLPKGSRTFLEGHLLQKCKLTQALIAKGGIEIHRGKKPAGVIGLDLAPNERVLVTLTNKLPPDTPAGDYPLSIMQREAGQSTGGVTFISRVDRIPEN
jgi:subtilisin family serine protease